MKLRNIYILLVILLTLGGYFYFSNSPQPEPEPEKKVYAWDLDENQLEHIEIRLPREAKSQAFIQGEDRLWYFDDPQRSKIDMQRWGGGIPLLLSGPGIERVIAQDATPEKLAEFGLAQPQMEIVLQLEGGDTVNIAVGDRTPDGTAFYVQVPDSNDVCLVDYTWYEVLERLVKEPPHAPASTD